MRRGQSGFGYLLVLLLIALLGIGLGAAGTLWSTESQRVKESDLLYIVDMTPRIQVFTGDGVLFMLRVRGDSMIDAGILNGDFVVVRQGTDVKNSDIIVAGIPGEEATVKTYHRSRNEVTLTPQNAKMDPMKFPASDVTIFGKVVTVLRRL